MRKSEIILYVYDQQKSKTLDEAILHGCPDSDDPIIAFSKQDFASCNSGQVAYWSG